MPIFFENFTKENIIRELDRQGVWTTTYRLVDSGKPMYVNMKITRMLPDKRHIIMGISIIDSQMKKQEEENALKKERTVYRRIAALSGNYLALYTVDPETDRFFEYSASDEYKGLGLSEQGEDFFLKGVENGKWAVYRDDLDYYLSVFSKENIMKTVNSGRIFSLQYRLMLGGEPVYINFRAALVEESDGKKLIVGMSRKQ